MRLLVGIALLVYGSVTMASSLDLSPYRNKVVLVDFWASWCSPCKASFPWLNAMQRKYEREGLAIVTVNLDEDRQAAQAFLQNQPSALTVVYDPDGLIAKTYNLVAMPTSFLLDRRGTIRFRHNGFLETKTTDYENHLRTLLRE